jgi:hypothetical protein
MRLTWRDGLTTLLAILVVAIYAAHAAGVAIPVVDGARGATLLIGIAGFGMCLVAGTGAEAPSKGGYTVLASALGISALSLIVVSLITGWDLAVPLLAADTVLLWLISTAHHAREEIRAFSRA